MVHSLVVFFLRSSDRGEGELVGELQAHHDHARDPEEDDVEPRLEQRRRVERLEVGRTRVGPAEHGEREEARREPRVEHVLKPCRSRRQGGDCHDTHSGRGMRCGKPSRSPANSAAPGPRRTAATNHNNTLAGARARSPHEDQLELNWMPSSRRRGVPRRTVSTNIEFIIGPPPRCSSSRFVRLSLSRRARARVALMRINWS